MSKGSVRNLNALQELQTIPGSGKVTDATSAVKALADTAGAIPEHTRNVRVTVRSGTLLFSCDGEDPAGNGADVMLENNAMVFSIENAQRLKLSGAIVYSQALTY